MNKVEFSGNLVRDAEAFTLPSGSVVTRFRLAVKSAYKKDDKWVDGETLFIDVNHFNGRALELKKGDPVEVMGRLRERTWEKDGARYSKFEVIAYKVTLKQKNAGNGSGSKTTESKEPTPEEVSSLDPF